MKKLDIHSHTFLRNLMKVMAGKKYRLYTFRDYLELQHTDNTDYSVIIKEDSWKGVNLAIQHKYLEVYFKGNYITETRLLNAVEESLKVVDSIINNLVGQIQTGQEDVAMLLGGINFCNNDKFSASLVEGLKEIAEEYGVTFRRTNNYLFLTAPNGNDFISVFTTGVGKILVGGVVNSTPITSFYYPSEQAVFRVVRTNLAINLGIKPKSEEEPKPKYTNLEMMKRSQDFIIAEEGDEILVDFVAFHVPYYATIKDGEITYSINTIDAEDEHIKLDMDKINQLKEVCEFIIG